MKLEEMVREERLKRGISQYKLAEMTGFTRRAIVYWETGKRKMTVDAADTVFKALGVTVLLGKGGIHASSSD